MQRTGHPYLAREQWDGLSLEDGLDMRDQGIWRQGTLSALLGYRARDLLSVAKPETQGVFVWVIAAGSSKGCRPGADRRRGTGWAVGQVDGHSCGHSSLSVWVGEGELAFVP